MTHMQKLVGWSTLQSICHFVTTERAEMPTYRAPQSGEDGGTVPVEKERTGVPFVPPRRVFAPRPPMGLMGAREVHMTPQHLRVQSAEGHRQHLVTWGNLSSRQCPACLYHCPLSLQVNFVAAIDVYEDGEAGLLLCYNCK